MIATTKKIAVFVALAASCGLGAIALTGEALGSRSPAAEIAVTDAASERIAGAFALLADMPEGPALKEQAKGKGDRLATCGSGAWPAIRSQCLVGADGEAPRPAARTVTVEVRRGQASSTLVRMPVDLVASR